MIQPRTLPGFMELLPNDQILFNRIKDVIRKNYERYGFLPLDTPVLESSDVLLAKAGGETEKQIYQFKKGDNDLCMRFDLTVPLAKYVAENFNELSFPFARYQIDKVYRGERPQKGRFREFYQCDIDVIGKDSLSLYYDALVPSIMYNIFKELNLGDFKIFVSNRKILLGLLEQLNLSELSTDILRLVDKIEKIGQENFVLSLKDYNLSSEQIEKICQFVSIKGTVSQQLQLLKEMNIQNENFVCGINELEVVTKNMQTFGIGESNFAINLSIARGLDYYTGTVYETFICGKESLGSICSGGRFDNLAGFYTKEHLPGVGMSIGLTRLFYELKENNMLDQTQNSIAKVIILPMGDEYVEKSIMLSNTLRQNEINTNIYLENTKFKTKLAYAIKSNIRYAIFMGEDEINNNVYTIKDLLKQEQQTVKLEELLKILKQN